MLLHLVQEKMQSISDAHPTFKHACRKFQDASRGKEKGTEPPGKNAGAHGKDVMATINEDDVNGKAHKKRMDLLARFDPQAVTGLQPSTSQQPFDPGRQSIGFFQS
jgi:hypothetical protein